MGKKLFFFIKAVFVLLFFSLFSCIKESYGIASAQGLSLADINIPVYQTWNSLGEMLYRKPDLQLTDYRLYHPLQNAESGGFFPWAGIVSHHILAHDYIDAWFSRLSQLRDIKTFFIISPDHYGLSLQDFSLTVGSWDSGFGLVESEREKVMEISFAPGAALDPNVFYAEHGVSSLMPYIKKYFPDAKAAAVVVRSESEVNTKTAGMLADILEKEFDDNGKKSNFLLISSDFSHNEGIEKTALNDNQSLRYLKNEEGSFWNMVICDNRFGVCVLDRIGKNNMESFVYLHSNSFEISGINYDITSYFFVYFADRM